MKLIKKTIALILALALCLSLVPATLAATEQNGQAEPRLVDSGKCGDHVSWTLTDDGVLTITGTGPMYNYGNDPHPGSVPWKQYIHTDIKKFVVEPGVTTVCPAAVSGRFSQPDGTQLGVSALEEIVIPGTVKTIGASAFDRCVSLKKVSIGYGVERIKNAAFDGCTALKSITLPDSVKVIEQYAFSGCSSLKKFVIPNGVKKMNAHILSYCTALEQVMIPASVTYISYSVLLSCPALADKYYPGSAEMWKDITLYTNHAQPYCHTYLKRAKLHTYYKYVPYCDITGPKYSVYRYTGEEIKPLIRVYTVNGTRLKEGVNYKVSYQDNVYPGTATVKITGIGKYSGTATRQFRIRADKLEDLRFTESTDTTAKLAWTADAEAVKYQVLVDGRQVGETTKKTYTLANLDGKSHDVEVRSIRNTSSGDAAYIGQSSAVRLTAMKDCYCSAQYSRYYYTGEARCPVVRVSSPKWTRLSAGKNYTVRFENNVELGTANAIITGVGKYYGTKTIHFYIIERTA